MSTIRHKRARWSLLALPALAVAGLGFSASAGAESGAAARDHAEQRLVVRGDATVADSCDASGCAMQIEDGAFSGSPVGTGAYSGAMKLLVAEAFPNGEGGVCAPIRGEIVLGDGSVDRLVLAVSGDSCQDGAGDPRTSSFTGLAQFRVKHGSGAYAHASGRGVASFSEDAADRDRMTLIGRISL